MKTNKLYLKHFLLSITLFVMFVIASVFFMQLTLPATQVFAKDSSTTKISISNSDFETNTQSTTPYDPSNFTAYAGNKPASKDGAKTNATAGVVKEDGNHYLKIDSNNYFVNYGYRTDSSITLDANSYFYITTNVKTDSAAKVAKLYLYNGEEAIASMSVGSPVWTPCTFFVATSDESVNLKLGLYLEGKGVACFDDINAFKTSEKTYNSLVSTDDKNKTEKSYETVLENNFYVDGKLFKDSESSKTSDFVDYKLKDSNSSLNSVNDTNNSNQFAIKLAIDSDKKTYAQYSTNDNFVEFEPNLCYKVSVQAKTTNLSGTAVLQLVQTGVEESKQKNSSIISITSNTSSNQNNGYENFDFYIYSNPVKSTSYKLIFGLGKDDDSLTSGELFLSGVKISKIDYDSYSNASTGSKVVKLDMVNHDYAESNMLKNGDFNAIKIADETKPFPATPSDWSVSLGNGEQIYGVINTKNDDCIDLLSDLKLYNPDSKMNNVLMMYNKTADTISYKSSETSEISASGYAKFDFSYKTNSKLKLSLVATKDNSEFEVAKFNLVANSSNDWQTASVYFHNGYSPIKLSLKITLETESNGYAFVDDFKYNFDGTPTSSDFENRIENNYTFYSDLSNMVEANNAQSLFSIDNNNAIYQIVDIQNGEGKGIYVGFENKSIFTNTTAKNAVAIRLVESGNATLTSNIGFKFTKDKYYKVSVDVFTQNIKTDDQDVDLASLGAKFGLTDFDSCFEKINNSGWTTYTFFIKPNTDTTSYLKLSLGEENLNVSGDVFFANIKFEDSTINQNIETEFNNASESETIKKLETVVENSDNDSSEPESEEKSNNSAWIYYIPSLVFAVAIVICVVGVLARKVKWKKPSKKSKNDYDRKSASQQIYMRKATVARENKLIELNKDKEKLIAERTKYEEEYKHNMTVLRQLKIKRADVQEIKKVEHEIKKYQRLSASIGVTLNKVEGEIEYAKTDAYLNTLAKKIAYQQQIEQDDNTKK